VSRCMLTPFWLSACGLTKRRVSSECLFLSCHSSYSILTVICSQQWSCGLPGVCQRSASPAVHHLPSVSASATACCQVEAVDIPNDPCQSFPAPQVCI
jgi:hypothetical protein